MNRIFSIAEYHFTSDTNRGAAFQGGHDRILAGILPECRLESRHGRLERLLHGGRITGGSESIVSDCMRKHIAVRYV
jgi:hypothetical protein